MNVMPMAALSAVLAGTAVAGTGGGGGDYSCTSSSQANMTSGHSTTLSSNNGGGGGGGGRLVTKFSERLSGRRMSGERKNLGLLGEGEGELFKRAQKIGGGGSIGGFGGSSLESL